MDPDRLINTNIFKKIKFVIYKAFTSIKLKHKLREIMRSIKDYRIYLIIGFIDIEK